MTDRDKLINRVKRLQALAGNNPSEAEAAAAAERAHELIAKYQIQASELGDKPDMGDNRSFVTSSRPWRRYMGPPLAELYFCRYGVMYERAPGKKSGHDRHIFIGRETNTHVCGMMFAYLCTSVDRLANKASKDVPDTDRSSFVNSFKLGCAVRIAQRLTERLKEAKAKPTVRMRDGEADINLPALADAYDQESRAVTEYFDKKFETDDAKARQPQPKDRRGLLAGFAAGATVGLDQQLGNGQKKLLA